MQSLASEEYGGGGPAYANTGDYGEYGEYFHGNKESKRERSFPTGWPLIVQYVMRVYVCACVWHG